MENMGDWEAKNLVNELTRGKDLARQLQMHLNNRTSSSQETCEYLVQKILISFEKGISMLNWPNPGLAAAAVAVAGDQMQPQHGAAGTSVGAGVWMSESPPSLGESPRSDQDSDRDQEHRDASKKRKSLPRWTKQVRVSPGVGLEGPLDDGFSWRKYGQKDILGAKYPRGYYRCTHRNVQGCLATKQVQRSDDDPNIFEITYRGRHTCNQPPSNTISPIIEPISQENQEQPRPNTNTIELSHIHPQDNMSLNVQLDEQNQQPIQLDHDMLSSIRSGLKVITEGLNDNNLHFASTSSTTHRVKAEVNDSLLVANTNSNMMGNTFVGTEFSPTASFHVSPATSATSYFSMSPRGGIGDHFGVNQNFHNPNSETEINTNSATNNTPNVGNNVDFPFGHVDDQFGPNFTFGHPGYF